MEYTLKELSQRKRTCTKERNFPVKIREEKVIPNVRAAITKRRVLKAALFGEIDKSDIDFEMESSENGNIPFSEAGYPTTETTRIEKERAVDEIKRYLDSETRHLQKGMTQYIDLGHDVETVFAADAVHVKNGAVEVIKFETGKPRVSERKADKDLGLYAMLKYGRAYVPEGETYRVTASYYSLRKKNDNWKKGLFDRNFFDTEKGKNIVSISEYYTGGDEESPFDVEFEPLVKEFAEGKRAENCSDKDCEECSLKPACKYLAPVPTIQTEQVTKPRSAMRFNEEQMEAIESLEGIILVVAGAGSGKTAVLANRVATLLDNGTDPEKILCIAFTDAARLEMQERLRRLIIEYSLDIDYNDIPVMTFNGFGGMVLEDAYKMLSFDRAPMIMQDVDRSAVINKILKSHPTIPGLDYQNYETKLPACKGALTVAQATFDVIKREQLDVFDVDKAYAIVANEVGDSFVTKEAVQELMGMYGEYDEALRKKALIEFADQEVMLFEILTQDPFFMERYGFEHILVDECQDVTETEHNIVKTLIECPSYQSAFYVGDDWQSIYRFRHAAPEIMMNLSDFLGREVKRIDLVKNYRCSPEIVNESAAFVRQNRDRLEKEVIAMRPSEGIPVEIKGFLNVSEEHKFIAARILMHLADGVKPRDICVIMAKKTLLRRFAKNEEEAGIEYTSISPEPLMENSRVAAALALADAIRDPRNTRALFIYANAKAGGTLIDKSEAEIQDAMDAVREEMKKFRKVYKYKEKKDMMMKFLNDIAMDDEAYLNFLTTFQYRSLDEVFEYCDNFKRFGSSATAKRDKVYDNVTNTTAHSSKGLEWKICYVSWTDFYPYNLSFEDLEEKRRLCYVTMTRARDQLVVTSTFNAFGNAEKGYTPNLLFKELLELNGRSFERELNEAQAEEDTRKAAEAAAKKAAKKAVK